MPRMGGIDAIRQLKLRGFPGIIIGSTGNSTHDDFFAEGVSVVLRKPYSEADLKEAVCRGRLELTALARR